MSLKHGGYKLHSCGLNVVIWVCLEEPWSTMPLYGQALGGNGEMPVDGICCEVNSPVHAHAVTLAYLTIKWTLLFTKL